MAIVAYLESVTSNPFEREDKRAFTLAIDADYGIGKSFFVRRLAETLRPNHPVAFVDAWADDLADEPLVALAATLKNALAPLASHPGAQQRLKDFMSKSGKVAKIVSGGLIRRGAGLLITAGAVDAIGDELSGATEELKDAVTDAISSAGQEAVDDVFEGVSTTTLMETRIAEFEDGQRAVRAMKESLAALVNELANHEALHAPIIIIIDELDRCRPTYTLKLLEEIKHLFDVSGLVFILAMNGEQLGHSISGAYGSNFDGQRYMRRFIDRRYRLATPGLAPLLKALISQSGLDSTKFFAFPVTNENGSKVALALHDILATYMTGFGLTARDAFELVDILRTCQALRTDGRLILPYLRPLIIAQMKGQGRGELPTSWTGPDLRFRVPSQEGGSAALLSFKEIAEEFEALSRLDPQALEQRYEQGNETLVYCVVNEAGFYQNDDPLDALRRYPDLIEAVTRFDSPITQDGT